MTMTFTLPESSAELLVKRAATALARAKAHGLPSPHVTIGERWVENVPFYDALARIRGAETDYRSRGCRMASVTVEPHEPPAGEWKLVGHREAFTSLVDGRRIKTVSGFGKVPHGSEGTDLCCDHCGHKRQRKLSFILEKTGTDQLVEVGTNCVEAFTGTVLSSGFLASLRDHRRILASLTDNAAVAVEINEQDMIDEVRTVLAVACSVLGWSDYRNSRTAELEGDVATWRIVFDEMARYRTPNLSADEINVTADDFLKAEEIERFYLSHDARGSDFGDKVRDVITSGIRGRLDFAVITAAAASFDASMERAIRDREIKRLASRSKHAGEVGERLEFVGRVHSIRNFSTEFGECSAVSISDEFDRLLTWMTNPRHGLVAGNEYVLKGTVAKHTYNSFCGVLACDTRISRVKIVRDIGPFQTVSDIEAETQKSEAADSEIEDVFGASF